MVLINPQKRGFVDGFVDGFVIGNVQRNFLNGDPRGLCLGPVSFKTVGQVRKILCKQYQGPYSSRSGSLEGEKGALFYKK